ncbi:Acetylcholinesterase [Trachymyrmex septentrionalis]|uniref:Carboxylic ester hydrolase n=1 Tax=Trachymyrmex septentrionalis TaxID=34720 RepID=A0A195EWI8_9HYME|nr:Acetylcholinesterase [Trachymyrmex septentrionalis]
MNCPSSLLLLLLGLSLHSACITRANVAGQHGSQDGGHESLVVETTSGLMRGFSRTVLDREVHVFYGVPFAKPPVGPLRFRKPLPIEPWHGILNATTLPNSCYQERYEYFPGFEGEEMWNPNTNISEDCLYLNIWVPQKLRLRHKESPDNVGNNGMAILVWVYGGGFMSGTATLDVYDADIMAAAGNAIIASIQYRVGAFGFLYLNQHFVNSEEAPGNMGLWDQALALKWLRENARVFGGDPDLITIFGESAGGSSVSLHLISPVTQGLVRRGILQSGTLNAPWSYMTGEKANEVARVLVDDCGCNSTMLQENPARVMACMRSVDAKTLSVQQWNSYWGILGFPSAPTIDGVFLPKDPLDLVREADFKNTEILIGNNENEGRKHWRSTSFSLEVSINLKTEGPKQKLSRASQLGFQLCCQMQYYCSSFRNLYKFLFQYTDWDRVNDGYHNQRAIADIVGDYFFICPSTHFAQLFADRGMTVYYYFFTQRTSTNVWGKWMGVMHGDEVEYVFGHPLNKSLEYTDNERDLSLRMIHYFSRFAYTGMPTVTETEWPSYTRNHPKYFIWNAEKKNAFGRGPRTTACAFWNEFLPRLKGVPDPTPEACKSAMASSVSAGVSQLHSSSTIASIILLPVLVPDWAEKFHRRYRPTNRSYNERCLRFKVVLAVVNIVVDLDICRDPRLKTKDTRQKREMDPCNRL